MKLHRTDAKIEEYGLDIRGTAYPFDFVVVPFEGRDRLGCGRRRSNGGHKRAVDFDLDRAAFKRNRACHYSTTSTAIY